MQRIRIEVPGLIRNDRRSRLVGQQELVVLTVRSKKEEAIGIVVVFSDDSENGGHSGLSQGEVSRSPDEW
jgi:hypothetical protein